MLNPPHPGSKHFEELILDYDINPRDRRKYNFLMKNVPSDWLVSSDLNHYVIFDAFVNKLVQATKVPKYAYYVILEPHVPEKKLTFWKELSDPNPVNWDKIFIDNFKCSISTRSFYFKLFHKAIALNNFLFKIKRKNSPNCSFCDNEPETYLHLFIECQTVKPIWDDTIKTINQKIDKVVNFSIFKRMFGYEKDMFLTYLFFMLKYYIYLCKFQSKIPKFQGFRTYIDYNKDLEYRIAKKKNKLPLHFKKWKFVL